MIVISCLFFDKVRFICIYSKFPPLFGYATSPLYLFCERPIHPLCIGWIWDILNFQWWLTDFAVVVAVFCTDRKLKENLCVRAETEFSHKRVTKHCGNNGSYFFLNELEKILRKNIFLKTKTNRIFEYQARYEILQVVILLENISPFWKKK